MGYRERRENFAEIGRELRVATLLAGVVQRSAENVRMNVRLIDAQTGDQLWAETYDRQMTASNVFAIQSEIALSIADALDARLGGDELARVRSPPTQNTRAYDLYLSGMRYARSPDFQVHQPLAIRQLEEAVQEAPEFAAAWAELSMARVRMRGAQPETLAAAQKALELDPSSPDARLAMAWYWYAAADFEAALRELEAAERANGNSVEPLILRAQIYEQREQWVQALATIERTLEFDPRNVELLLNQSRIHMTLRNYAEAERSVERALAIAPDGDSVLLRRAQIAMVRDGDVSLMKELASSPLLDPSWRLQLGWQSAIEERDYERALEYLAEFDRNRFDMRPGESYYGLTYALAGSRELAREQFEIARRRVEEALALRPDDPRLMLAHAETLAGAGEAERAVEVAQLAISLMSPREAREAVRVAIHWVYVPAGDFDAALEALDAYLGSPAPFSIEGLLVGPRLDALRDDPRFQGLVEKYRRDRVH
jgi:tetratricopeptide (TPR) repeat protein